MKDNAVAAAAADPYGSFMASVQTYLGTVAVDIVNVLLITSAFAALLATQNIAARYLYTLGEDGVLPRRLGVPHRRFGSPFLASIIVALLCLVGFAVAAIAGIDPLIFYPRMAGFGGICLLTLMTLTAVAVVVYFRRDTSHEANAWQSVISPILAFAGLATILFLAVKNAGAVIGASQTLGWIVAGLAAVHPGRWNHLRPGASL